MNNLKIVTVILLVLVLNGLASAQKNKAEAAGTITPIVDLNLGGLLGGVREGKWVKDQETAESLKEKTEFVFINENSEPESGTMTGLLIEPEPPCDEYFGMKFESSPKAGIAVGSSAKWDLFPRKPFKLSADNNTYKRIVTSFLQKRGLRNTTAKIKSIFKIDLDGDKQDEVVIAATYYQDGLSSSARAGDYSFVIVRKIVRKSVVEILLAGDFIKKDVEFGAPSEYDISAIADLNGDGIMEIVVFGAYYEGAFSSVFEITGQKAKSVLETGCGV